MTRETSARILVLLSMAFGLTIAVLAMTDSGGIGLPCSIRIVDALSNPGP